MTLDTLLRALPQGARVDGPDRTEIASLAIDSRRVTPGAFFVALRGQHADGRRFVGEAVTRGAVAVMTEERCDVPPNVANIVVPDTALALSRLADVFFGSPSHALAVAGVTGTNGKTTTVQMIAAMLDAAGIPSGSIGTLGASFAGSTAPLDNTTPLAVQLHELLAGMRERGAQAVAMEVSSHALALERTADVRFAAAGLTNVTRDHLDFHRSFDAYAAAKRKLFEQAERCVLNADDEYGERWARDFRVRKPVTTYALNAPADLRAEDLDLRPDGSTFAAGGRRYTVHLPGRFNVANALCALGVARALGAADAACAKGLENLRRVPGRMDHLREHGIDVVVDYAHTPDALENLMRALRETTAGRLWAVFGCGGDRDRGKRSQMGAVAARLADYIVITSDNPRNEDPNAIIAEIAGGVGQAEHTVIGDRREAIGWTIAHARSGDTVAIAGKGHEGVQIIGAQVLPFDDVAVAREALSRRGDAA